MKKTCATCINQGNPLFGLFSPCRACFKGDNLNPYQSWMPMPAVPEKPKPETVLEEAQRLVGGDRGADYGHPLDNFEQTAKLWSAIKGVPFSPEDVGMFMICVKLSRLANKFKRDSLTDIAGYAETINMVVTEKERRANEGV